MKKTVMAAAAALAAVSMPMVALAPAAVADGMPTPDKNSLNLHAQLNPFKVNKVHGNGSAKVHLKGNHVSVKIKVSGLLKGAPHAQHFHIGAKGQCPPDSAATKHNGKLSLSTVDGQPFYGKIGTSLTTKGDTSPDSALAVDRFPAGSMYTYERSFEVSDASAKSLREGTAVVVVHGIDYNGNGKYDFNLGKSLLDPKLPAEATFPALCGALKKGPHGGISGGLGGTQNADGTTTAVAGIGGAVLLGAAGVYWMRRRPVNQG